MKRKAIPKKVREAVYNKYDGHCAYCGKELDVSANFCLNCGKQQP